MSTARIIAIANHKGGVGKTTTAVSLATDLAQMGHRSLLIDLDAQANATTTLMSDEPRETIYGALRGLYKLPKRQVRPALDIVPSSLDLAGIDLEIGSVMSREYLLADLLEPERSAYEYIIIDTAPSLGLLTINAFTAAHEVIIPLTAEALPSRGLIKLEEIVAATTKRLNRGLIVSGILLTRYNAQKKLTKVVEEAIRARYGAKVYEATIRENVAIAEAPFSLKAVGEYSPSSNGAKDYHAFTLEFLQRQEGAAR